jgi:hypothetical protein
MSRKRIKQYLLLLTAVGVIAVAASGAGTFASFSAQTTNKGSTFATGSLLLSNTVGAQSACLSEGDTNHAGASGNNNPSCDAVLTLSAQEPGSPIQYGTLVVKNVGTLAGSTLTLKAPSATDCTDTQVNDHTFNTGSLCQAVLLSVQETAQSGVGETGEGTYSYCWYGNGAGTSSCTSSTSTLDSDTTDTIQNFDTNDASPGIRLYPLSASGTTDTTGNVADLASNASRTFKVGLYLPKTSSDQNALQDVSASFGLTWNMQQ